MLTAAPATAVTLQPKMSVKTLTMGEQKKIIPMLREPTHAAGDTERRKPEWMNVWENLMTSWRPHWLSFPIQNRQLLKSPRRLLLYPGTQTLTGTHPHPYTVPLYCEFAQAASHEFPFWIVFINHTLPCLYMHPFIFVTLREACLVRATETPHVFPTKVTCTSGNTHCADRKGRSGKHSGVISTIEISFTSWVEHTVTSHLSSSIDSETTKNVPGNKYLRKTKKAFPQQVQVGVNNIDKILSLYQNMIYCILWQTIDKITRIRECLYLD